MSAQASPFMGLARPPQVDDPKSIEFMHKDLARSGLVPEDMDCYPVALQAMGTTAAYVIPYADPKMYRMRLDRATDKYTQPKGIRDVWWSPKQDINLFRTKNTIYLIEGEKKAAKFVKTWPGLPAFGIGGAHNALVKDVDGTRRLLTNILRTIKPGMKIVAIFDGDIQEKPGIQQAAHALNLVVKNLACEFEVYRPPLGKGVDDWLVDDPHAQITDLIKIELRDLEASRKQLWNALELSMGEKGPILNENNAAKILAHRFADVTFIDRRIGLVSNGETKSFDELEVEAMEYVQGTLLPHMPMNKITKALGFVLLNSRRDLVQELFRRQKWDGTPRLDTWAVSAFDSNWDAYTNEWGRLLMTGLVLRVLQPGTKVDRACILAGPQGIGKSTFFEELSSFDGYKFYHACTELSSDAGDASRTQTIAFAKSIIVDLAEGVVFENRKATMDRAKQRITQVEDEYREVYAKSTRIEKRGFVFVGTTNRMDQLGDHTGSRRFLPIHVTRIHRMPYETKMQIIAEVVAKEEQIRQTNWFDLRIRPEDAPEDLRKDKEHIEDAQTLMNTQFARPDPVAEFVLNILTAREAAVLRDSTDKFFITAGFISARAGNGIEFRSKSLIARMLSSLASSTTFPYKLEVARKRMPQLVIPANLVPMYEEGISNAQAMLNGYVVTKKVN